MNTTSNLHLKKPSGTDPIDISVLNENADTLDAFAGETNTAIAGKQDTIADISEIRSGAAAGATAVQQTAFETDQARQETEIGVVANAGAKNRFNISATPKVNHTDYTLTNGKLTVSANGSWAHYSVPVDLPEGDYTLSMMISDYSKASGAPDASMRLRMSATTSGDASVILQTIAGNGDMRVPFTWTGGTLYLQFYPNYNSTSYTNSFSVERVMIHPASITDDTFVPYAKTNRELTVAEDEDRAALVAQVDGGAKNLLRITASSQVVGGVMFTINADGTITANGTKTNNDWFYLSTGNSLAADTYVLSSGLTPQSNMNIRLLITTADSLGSAIMSAEGERQVQIKQLTSDYTGLYYAIRISSGTTVNNIVFKPMLCTAEDYAISHAFVPYAPTNRELYEMILALQSGS